MWNYYRKTAWYQGERVVQDYYERKWFQCVDKNFTIRGGELDLVMENEQHLVVVEVKVVNYIEHLHDYITTPKLQALQKSIQTYLWRFPTKKEVRLDVVFVRKNEIVHLVEWVEV